MGKPKNTAQTAPPKANLLDDPPESTDQDDQSPEETEKTDPNEGAPDDEVITEDESEENLSEATKARLAKLEAMEKATAGSEDEEVISKKELLAEMSKLQDYNKALKRKFEALYPTKPKKVYCLKKGEGKPGMAFVCRTPCTIGLVQYDKGKEVVASTADQAELVPHHFDVKGSKRALMTQQEVRQEELEKKRRMEGKIFSDQSKNLHLN